MLWSGTLGLESPLLDRFPAAMAGGFDHLSLSALDVARAAERAKAPCGSAMGNVSTATTRPHLRRSP